jgi:hypothetical protein
MGKFMPKLKAAKTVTPGPKMAQSVLKPPMNAAFKNGPEMKIDRAAHKVMGPGYKHTGSTTGSNGGPATKAKC